MERDESLAPLSREHHTTLLLAQLLRLEDPKYKGMPTATVDKAEYATQVFNNAIQPHFNKEEEILNLVLHHHIDIDIVIQEVFEEHVQLSNLFLNIHENKNNQKYLAAIGNALEAHVRKEERILFPLLQKHCTLQQLQQIHELLH
ncbi:MAG: hemerythrin domain-containing protein [Chitinophagaceae bacterium]|jgi:iron-sulfur cluster repair protein YtfE (RIC family)|nr:hemerythrin domain-containing protein [Chitinophagaceae bacterium]